MILKDLLNDVLKVLDCSVDDLEHVMFSHDEISGNLQVGKSATFFCLPLQSTSFRENILSELNNTVVLQFDKITINDIISKVGIFISSSEGIVEINARILGYYTLLGDGKVIVVNSWQLYQTIEETV